jgi:hypothetical protein
LCFIVFCFFVSVVCTQRCRCLWIFRFVLHLSKVNFII